MTRETPFDKLIDCLDPPQADKEVNGAAEPLYIRGEYFGKLSARLRQIEPQA